MLFYFVRHGEANLIEEDSERGLSAKGIKEAELIGARLKAMKARPLRILHSSKKRAIQTAQIIYKHLTPPGGIYETPGLNPNDDIEKWVARLAEETTSLMLVGHLPFLAVLAAELTGENPDDMAFETATALCIDRTDQEGFKKKWKITPREG
ncbi:MAG: phosphohistidine phosphatase SixA [Deltaproteobacteria bacterium]|nr:phosphohistidine phosphatase SixA [Deltaproteobacteria bacterium]